ncbi:MAG: NAD-dependent epimerase/dehydratase family protein [Deltaproteobacteria bacterium]|nr:NAD-dependent epimerase/dehydratase family protein [Deltaproteobacteria bacterium]
MGAKETVCSNINKVLVTGGGGFVGRAIVRMLTERGVSCRVIGRNRYPEIEEMGGECLVGDISDRHIVLEATRDVDTVFHVAALAGIWGPWHDYYTTNVIGTENVIHGCQVNNVARLIYTSTPSVVFDQQDIRGGDESLPYASRFLCNYAKSKMMAEKIVLSADSDSLHSCAIRPHLIWGPGDPHLIPRLVESGKNGKLKIIGSGNNMVDISYIDNVAHGHLLAADNLASAGTAAGNAYFLGQEKPVVLWQWVNVLFSKTGIPQVTASVPFAVAYCIGALLESAYRLCRIRKEPAMTRFVAYQLSKSHYFSHDRARRDLGYSPVVSVEEGMERTVRWVKEHDQNGT